MAQYVPCAILACSDHSPVSVSAAVLAGTLVAKPPGMATLAAPATVQQGVVTLQQPQTQPQQQQPQQQPAAVTAPPPPQQTQRQSTSAAASASSTAASAAASGDVRQFPHQALVQA